MYSYIIETLIYLKIYIVFGDNMEIMQILNRKGEWCERIDRTCQEGFCNCCEIPIKNLNYEQKFN